MNIITEWFGPTGSLQNTSFVASIIGPQGPAGTSVLAIDPRVDNRLSTSADGLYVPPVAEGEIIDMSLIFENALI